MAGPDHRETSANAGPIRRSVLKMSLRSVYLPEPFFENDRIHIRGEEHRHLLVARAEKDEVMEVFDGKENIWTVTVESIRKHETLVIVKGSRSVDRSSVELILA